VEGALFGRLRVRKRYPPLFVHLPIEPFVPTADARARTVRIQASSTGRSCVPESAKLYVRYWRNRPMLRHAHALRSATANE
jgi:hypothetical protein